MQVMSKNRAGRFQPGQSGNPKGRVSRQDRLQQRQDDWQSAIMGVGVAGVDKRQGMGFTADIVDYGQAIELWRGDDLAARVIETVPNEMVRQGFDLRISDDELEGADGKDLIEEITAEWEELGVVKRLWEALCYSRAYGGGAVLLGVDDGSTDLRTPLNLEGIKSLGWMTSLEARELTPAYYYGDPRAPKYGEVAIWKLIPHFAGREQAGAKPVNRQPQEIHESRIIVFPGIRVTRQQITPLEGWGDSVLTRFARVLRDFNIGWSSAGILLADFAPAVLKIKGLAEIFASDSDEAFKAKMKQVMLSRSVARLTIIDAEEDMERKQTPVGGLPELLDRFMSRLSAAADMPLTLLMGQSPGGLNATGESDIRFFYDRVGALRTRDVIPALEFITRIQLGLRGREPKRWSVEGRPLWQTTDLERSQSRKAQMETDVGYVAAGVISAEDVRMSRFGGDEYSYETTVDFSKPAPEFQVSQGKFQPVGSEGSMVPPPPAPPVTGGE